MTDPHTLPITGQASTLSKRKKSKVIYPIRRIRSGMLITLVGLLVFLIGSRPDLFGLDRSPVIGFIPIAVMLVGLGIICLGGYLTLISFWFKRTPSLASEIGMRLISTGYLVAFMVGFADIIGLGSHPFPETIPYFGEWQARGMQIGEGLIALGLLMMFPYTRSALFNGNHDLSK